MQPLSLNEYRIAMFAGEGLTKREIGAAVGTTPHTVRNVLQKVYRKLSISEPSAPFGGRRPRILLAAWLAKHQFNSLDEFLEYRRIGAYRAHLEHLWELASQPVKFPARRRRSDRQVPDRKAA